MIVHVHWERWKSTREREKGLVGVKIQGEHIQIEKLAGKAPTPRVLGRAVRFAIAKMGISPNEVEQIAERRCNPWRIEVREGLSGARDYLLRFLKDPEMAHEPIAARVHISMFGKMNIEEIFSGWIGDFVPLIVRATSEQEETEEDVEYLSILKEKGVGEYNKPNTEISFDI